MRTKIPAALSRCSIPDAWVVMPTCSGPNRILLIYLQIFLCPMICPLLTVSWVASPATFIIPFPISIKTAAATSSDGPARELSFAPHATGSMSRGMLFMRTFTVIHIACQTDTARWIRIRFNVLSVTIDILTDRLARMHPEIGAASIVGRTIR